MKLTYYINNDPKHNKCASERHYGCAETVLTCGNGCVVSL